MYTLYMIYSFIFLMLECIVSVLYKYNLFIIYILVSVYYIYIYICTIVHDLQTYILSIHLEPKQALFCRPKSSSENLKELKLKDRGIT